MSKTEIDIAILRAVTERIFNFIEVELGVKTLELSKDWYWDIPDSELYQVEKQPSELDIGSLVDDFQFVLAAFKNPDQAIPVTLIHVAPLLRMLADAVPSYTSPIK